jgi:hypothetical protein
MSPDRSASPDPARPTEAEQAIIDQIAGATWRPEDDGRSTPTYWLRPESLEASALASCVARGFVVIWDRDKLGRFLEDGAKAVLTPLGAYLSRIVVTERWRYFNRAVKVPKGKKREKGTPKRERVAEEHPRYRTVALDRKGRIPLVWRRIVLPKQAREVELECAEEVVDPRPGPEVVMDEAGEAVGMFAREDEKTREVEIGGRRHKVKGVPMMISRKPLKGKA